MRPYATALTIALLLLSMGFSAQAQTCPTPIIVQTGGSNPSCAALPVTLDAGPGVTYLWSNGATTRYITDTPTATASYTVTVTDANGCSATSAALTVTVNPVNGATVLTAMPSVCAGSSGQAHVAPPPSGVTWEAYAWSITNGVIVGSSTGQFVDFTAGPTGTVTLTAQVTDQNGCQTTATTNISVYETTTPPIQAPSALCAGVRSSAQVNYPPYYQTYSWSISGGVMEPAGVDGGPNTNRVFFTANGPGPVTLTVTVTDNHGCPITNTTTIPVRTVAPPVIRLDNATMCPGSINYASIDPPSEGTWQYVSWSIQNGSMGGSYPPFQPQTSVPFTSDFAGQPVTLTVSATDSFGCTNTSSVTVPVRTVAPPVIHLDNATMCPGSINYASIDPPAQGSWQYVSWSIQNGSMGGSYPPFQPQTSVPFTSDFAGQPVTLTVSATDSFGCTNTSSVTVPVRTVAPPVIRLDNPTMCAGSINYAFIDPPAQGSWQYVSWSIQNGSLGGSYPPYQPQTSVPFTSDFAGQPVTLTVTATDSFGCSNTSSVTVPVRTVAPPVIHLDNATMCAGSINYAFIDPPAQGSWQYVSWSIQNGSLGGSYPPYQPQTSVPFTSDFAGQPVTLTVTATDSFGCSNTSSVTVPVRTVAPPVIRLDTATMCPGSISFASIDPPAQGTWQYVSWSIQNGTIGNGGYPPSQPQTFVNFTSDPAGQPVTLTVTATDSFGCSNTSSATIGVQTIDPPTIQSDTSTICPNGHSFASLIPPQSGPSSYANIAWSITGGTITGSTNMPMVMFAADSAASEVVLSVVVRSYAGCSATASKTIAIAPPPPVTISVNNNPICPGAPGQANAVVPQGTTYSNYLWTISGGTLISSNNQPGVTFTAGSSGPVTLNVSVTDSNGCAPQGSITVPLKTLSAPEIVVQNPTACPNATNTASITPSPGFSYLWTVTNGTLTSANNVPSITFTTGASGSTSLSVLISDGQGCTLTRTASATIRSMSLATNAPPNGCLTAPSYSAYVANPSGFGGFHWSGTGNVVFLNGTIGPNVDFRVTDGGPVTLTVTATDHVAGCSSSASITRINSGAPDPQVTFDAPAVCAFGHGQLTVTNAAVYDGAPALTVSVTNGTVVQVGPATWEYTPSTSPVPANMTITVSGRVAPSNCPNVATFVVPVDNPAPPSVTVGQANCALNSIPLTSSSASRYEWSLYGNSTVLGTAQTYDVTTPGTYQVATWDGNSCKAVSAPVTVSSVPGPAPTVIPSVPNPVCTNSSVTLTPSTPAGAGVTYLWVRNGTPVASTRTYSTNTAGSYLVQVTDSFGCAKSSAPYSVTVAAPPPGFVIPANRTICPGGQVTLTAPSGNSWLWSTGATTRSITVSAAGTYTAQTSNGSGCDNISSSVITMSAPTATITADGPTTFCGSGSVNLTANAGTSYLWSTNATTQSINVTAGGNYSVTVWNSDGCSATATKTVTVNPAPTVYPWPQTPIDVCPNGTANASVGNASSFTSFAWSITNGTINGSATGSSVSFTASGSGDVQLSLSATDANGCTLPANVSVPLRTPFAQINLQPNYCLPQDSLVYVGVERHYNESYAWSVTGPATFEQDSSWPSQGKLTFTGQAGDVTLSLTITADSGCTFTTSTTTHANVTPALTLNAAAAVCSKTNNTASASMAGATSWTWFISGGTITSGQGTNSITYNITNSSATVSVQAGNGACIVSKSQAVTVEPTASISTSNGTSFCPGGNVQIAALPLNAASYLWSNGATTQVLSVDTPGTYSVTVTTAAGCTSTTPPVTITMKDVVQPQLSVTTLCTKGTEFDVTLTNASNYTYWFFYSNAAVVAPYGGATQHFMRAFQQATWVEVEVQTTNGCTLHKRIDIPEIPSPDTTITTSASTFCENGVYTASVPDAGPGATYNWQIGLATILSGQGTRTVTLRPTFFNNNPTQFYVEVTAPNGCLWFNVKNVPVTPATHINITTGVACQSTNSTATADDMGPGAVYNWTVGSGGTIISGQGTRTLTYRPTSAPGTGVTIGVTVPQAGSCDAFGSQVAVVQSVPTATITASGPTTFCAGGSVTLTASSGASYLWSNGATTQAITVTTQGDYSVTVTNAAGCSKTSLFTRVIVDNSVPTISASGPTSFCAGGSVTLTANYTPNQYASSYGFTWSNGSHSNTITVSTTGDYTVTITSNFGCPVTSAPIHVTRNVAATPTITAGGPTAICAGGSVTLTASSGASYLWSNGATTQSISATSAGSYSVTVTDANGCTATSAATAVTVNAPPAATITASGPTTFCAGGSVTLTASSGASYLWSNGATTQAITVTNAGSYGVTVTGANGCSASSAPTAVTVNALPTPTITASGPTAFCPGGSVTLTASSAAAYLWSNGATTQSITVSATGSYSVTVTDANGCSASSAPTAVTVNPLPTPTITAGGPTTFCAGGSVTLTASSAASYLWSNGATTQAITVTNAGSYSVTVTDANGCSATSAATSVAVNPLPTVTVTPSGPTTFCEDGGIVLEAGTHAGYTYHWSKPGTNGDTFHWVNVSQSGSYSVTVTDANGCSVTSAPIVVTVLPKPVAPVVSAPAAVCANGSGYTATITNYDPSLTYNWSLVRGTITSGQGTASITFTAGTTSPFGDTVSIDVSATGANGCAKLAGVAVPIQTPDATIVAGGPTDFCLGGSVTLTAPAGMSSYSWSNGATTQAITVTAGGAYNVTTTTAAGCATTTAAPVYVTVRTPQKPQITAYGPTTFCAGGSVLLVASSGGSNPVWSNGTASSSITVTQSGSYSVTYTDFTTGCSVTSDPVNVVVNPTPTATITAGGPTTFCAGGSVTLTASSGASYLWSNGATTQSITVSNSGSYSVTVTSAANCSAMSQPVTITVNAPQATISASGPTTFCPGGSVTLTSSAASSYLWSNGATTQSITVNAAGNYSVTVTNAAGCTATSAPTAVTVNASPSTPVVTAGGPTGFCAGGSVTLTSSAASSYLWSNGATTQSITVNATGNYSVTVTNAAGCTATSAPTAVTVNANPSTPVITAGGPTTFCAGGSVTLTAPASTSYLWSNGATTQSITVNAAGNYSVTVTNAAGCSATSAATSVTVNAKPTPTITPSGPTSFCSGGSVTLTSSAGSSYLWSNGATTQSITVNASGSYSVTVTNAAGCSATSAATTVTVNFPPNATITPFGSMPFCEGGGSITLASPQSTGYTYLWSDGATTANNTVHTAGTYSVTITNSAGCSATSAPFVVTTYALPTATVSGSQAMCAGGNATVSAALTGTAPWRVTWSDGFVQSNVSASPATRSVSPSSTTTYTVSQLLDGASNCVGTVSGSATVTVNANPSTPTITAGGPTTFCAGGSVTLTSSAGSSYLWSTGATTQSITVNASGSYTVAVTNASGCSATSAATSVTVNAAPATPTITAGGATTFCAGGSVTLTSSAGSSYLWSTGATTQSITVSASGNYTVAVSNASGCSATSAPKSVTVNALPTATITAGGPTSFCAGGSVTLTSSAGTAYLWSNGATTQSITVSAAGNYNVRVTNAAGCQATSANTTVTINPTTSITQPSNVTTTRNAQPVTLSVTATGANLTYRWYSGSAPNGTLIGTSSSVQVGPFNKRGTNSYYVEVTGSCGPMVRSAPVTVTVN